MKHLLIMIIYIINYIRKIPSVLLIVGILCGCFQNLLLSAQNMKSHHLADGTFKNNYIDSIDKPFSELLKWQWNRVSPEPLAFPLAENDPVFFKIQSHRTDFNLDRALNLAFAIRWFQYFDRPAYDTEGLSRQFCRS